MKMEILKLESQLRDVHRELQRLFKDGETIRKYYKYQNSNTDSTSESFIVGFSSVIGDTYSLICDLEELVELDSECECNDE